MEPVHHLQTRKITIRTKAHKGSGHSNDLNQSVQCKLGRSLTLADVPEHGQDACQILFPINIDIIR